MVDRNTHVVATAREAEPRHAHHSFGDPLQTVRTPSKCFDLPLLPGLTTLHFN